MKRYNTVLKSILKYIVYSSYAGLILFKFHHLLIFMFVSDTSKYTLEFVILVIYNTINPSITRFIRCVFYRNCATRNLKYRNSVIEKYMLYESCFVLYIYIYVYISHLCWNVNVNGNHVFRNVLKGLIVS